MAYWTPLSVELFMDRNVFVSFFCFFLFSKFFLERIKGSNFWFNGLSKRLFFRYDVSTLVEITRLFERVFEIVSELF